MSMCRYIEKNGKIETDCNHNPNKKKKITKIMATPFIVSTVVTMNPKIYENGKRIVHNQLSHIKRCYEGKTKGLQCKDSIDLIVFKDEKCSACHQYLPELQNRIELMKAYNIPVSLKIYDIRKDKVKSLLQKSKCKGLPCVIMRNIKNPKSFRKITDGIDKQISFFAKIMNEPNPLFKKVNTKKSPRGLVRKKG